MIELIRAVRAALGWLKDPAVDYNTHCSPDRIIPILRLALKASEAKND